MATPRQHLARAPIREAIVDISIAPKIPMAAIETAIKSVRSEFQKESGIWETMLGWDFDEHGTQKQRTESARVGTRLDSTNPAYVLQCRFNGLTLSRMNPYVDWSEIRDKAKQYWNVYRASAADARINRVAVRYINALTFPLPVTSFSEYLNAPPENPPELPQEVGGFLHRVSFSPRDNAYKATVTQALEGINGATDFTVLLDIDVHKSVDLPMDADEIWTALDALRNVKNQIFFAHLTEKAVEQFT